MIADVEYVLLSVSNLAKNEDDGVVGQLCSN